MASMPQKQFSDVSKIEGIVDDPVDLFRYWHAEARGYMPRSLDICCLATVSKDLKASSRSVVLREFDNDGFVLVTDKRSRKVSDMENVPNASMCFFWNYVNKKDQLIARQVRVEGKPLRLEKKDFQHLYDREPLFCKIRSHICQQGQKVDWDELKRKHDEKLMEFQKGENDLAMPDHFIGYKLLPTMVEFYHARDTLIGDRILYRRDTVTEPWEHCRIYV